MNIDHFFKTKNILLTGASGYLGKVILENLLRTCPDVKKIYLLVRPKKGLSPEVRIEKEILNSNCFDALKKNIQISLSFFIIKSH